MNGTRLFLSGRTTLVITAFYCAVYVYYATASEAPWQDILFLVRENLLAAPAIFAGCAHFGAKGLLLLARGKMKAAASGVVLVSAALLISGLYASAQFRTAEKRVVSAGDVIPGGLEVLEMDMDLPEVMVAAGEGVDLKIKNPSMVVRDKQNNRIIQAYPFTRTSAGYVSINDAGISPSLTAEAGGKGRQIGSLRLLPPGRTEKVKVPPDYSLEITLAPEREFKKGRLTAYEYNLSRPQYRTVVKKGGSIVLDRVIRDREKAKTAGLEFRYGTVRKWAEIVIVRDHAFLIVYVGLAGFCAGLLLLPLEIFYRMKDG